MNRAGTPADHSIAANQPETPGDGTAGIKRRAPQSNGERPLITALGWRLPPWLLDYGPVVLIVLVGMVAIAKREHSGGLTGRTALLWLALVITATAMVLRHRAPLAVLAVVLAISVVVNNNTIVILSVLLAVFTVAEYRDREMVVGAALAAAVVLLLTPSLHGVPLTRLGGVLSRVVAVGMAVAVGLYLRARADYVTGLRDRASRLERERELLAHQAVADERLRIARELHDVVAHNVSLMVVQSQALAATRPGDAEQNAALGRVADLGREALSEMHRMLGVLRLQNGSSAEREPQPGVRDLRRLISRTLEAGLDASLVVEGRPRELPPGVDLSAYRIVQEALTNVIRHAEAQHATVTLTYLSDSLEVSVVDDGNGPRRPALNGSAGASGHGLVGMRERVALFGGRLEAGARSGATGYGVTATLPVR